MAGRPDRARRRVVAWGTSVLISALVAGLVERGDLDVVQVEATLPAALCAVRVRRTHAVVCDVASVPATDVLALLASHPRLRVVVVLPNDDRGIALSCERPTLRTIDDLVAILLDGASDDDVPATTS